MRDILRLGSGERLGQPVHLIFEGVLLIAQVGQLALHSGVLALQVLQLRQDVIQLIQFLENLIAALFLVLRHRVELIQDRFDDVVDSAVLDHLPGSVGQSQVDAAIHEPPFLGLIVHFRRLPSPAVVIWLSVTPYFTRNAFTASARFCANLSLYAPEPT